MSFISIEFFIFFPCVLILNLLITRFNNKTLNNIFLLTCNYIFYSFFDIRFSLLVLLTTLVTYICALKSDKKSFFIFGVIFPIIILAFFKYFNFFLSTINLKTLNIILPLGISFYTFEVISYVVDVRLNKIEAETNFLVYATYVSFFPNIVSGPIERANNLLIQIKEGRKPDKRHFSDGIQIIVIGLFKKMVIADQINVFVTDVFNTPSAFNSLTIFLAIFSYSIQIYMDFSGYSDIAIGCANCLGFDFKKNFNLPYISQSISEFWNRWHISLSSWFKDYVYIPLGGNRKGEVRQYLNVIIVMTLSGLWHGASWNFVIWGLLNGILMDIEKYFKKDRFKDFKFYRVILTFSLISFTWVFFKAETFNKALEIFRCLFSFQTGIIQPYMFSFIGLSIVLVSIILVYKKDSKRNAYYPLQNLSTVKGLTTFFILIGLLLCLAYTNTSPFVYFQF